MAIILVNVSVEPPKNLQFFHSTKQVQDPPKSRVSGFRFLKKCLKIFLVVIISDHLRNSFSDSSNFLLFFPRYFCWWQVLINFQSERSEMRKAQMFSCCTCFGCVFIQLGLPDVLQLTWTCPPS
jgi:hypothetical protein